MAADTPGSGGAAQSQHSAAGRDAFFAARDLHVYPASVPAASQPGLFSLRPPYSRLPRTVHGRNDIAAELVQVAQESNHPIQVIHGLGGCGKTTVALWTARLAESAGIKVWWLHAADPATLTTLFRHLAIGLGADRQLVEAAWEGRLSAPDLLWERLMAIPDRWLMVIDEADDPMSLAIPQGLPCDGTSWLREAEHGSTIVTTRDGNPDVWTGADIHTVRELDAEQATEVLLELIDPGPVALQDADVTAAAIALADTLGGLPLALSLAGSYLQAKLRREVRRRGETVDPAGLQTSVITEYRAGVQRNVRLLDRPASVGGRLGQDATGRTRVMATWESSLAQLEQREIPEARNLLEVLSCFESAPIPLDVLDSATLSSSPVFGQAFDDERRELALEALADMALIEERTVAVSGGSIPCVHVHRLVLETVAAQSAADPERRNTIWAAAATALAHIAREDPADPRNWPHWTLLAPHCTAVVSYCPPMPEPVITILSFVQPAQDYFRRQGLHRQMLALTEHVLGLCSTVFGPEDPKTLDCRHNWIRALVRTGRGKEATDEYKSLWETRARVLGSDHPDTLESRARHAERLMMIGHLTEAEAEQAAVLTARLRVLGPDHPSTLESRSEHAITLRHLGRWDEAAIAHRSILADRERVLGPDHISTLTTRNNLAFTLDIMGYWREAEELHRINLETRLRLLGPDYPATLVSKANLAVVLRKQGRLDEAEALAREVLAARIRIFGPEHPTTLITRRHLVTILDGQGRAEEAEVEGRDVLALSRQALGDDHPSVLISEHSLATILCHRGRLAESEELHRRTLQVRLQRLGIDHPDTTRSRYGLAETLCMAGRLAEAEPLLQQVFDVRHHTFGPDHPDTLEAAGALANTLHAQGKLTLAEYRERLTSIHAPLRNRLGSDHPAAAHIEAKLNDLRTMTENASSS